MTGAFSSLGKPEQQLVLKYYNRMGLALRHSEDAAEGHDHGEHVDPDDDVVEAGRHARSSGRRQADQPALALEAAPGIGSEAAGQGSGGGKG